MKKLFTLIIFSIAFFSYAQGDSPEARVTIGVQGKDMYYKTEYLGTEGKNVYLTALLLNFQNDVYETASTDNVMSWINIYGALQLNSGSPNWTVQRNVDIKNRLLLYTDANGVLKPTNGEFVKFFSFTNENSLVSIDEVQVYVSDDTVMDPSEATVNVLAVIDNTLDTEDITFQTVTPYPNPFKDKLSIAGLKHDMIATIYDLTGKVTATSNVGPGNSELFLENLVSGMYILNLSDGDTSKIYTLVKN